MSHLKHNIMSDVILYETKHAGYTRIGTWTAHFLKIILNVI